MSLDFDWYDSNNNSVVIPEQMAVAVYTNAHGNVVIRQAGQYGPDEDVWIVVAPCHARALAEAILTEAGLDAAEPAPLALPAPSKDATAAERQRRRRANLRNGNRDSHAPSRVTGRDTVTDLPFLPSPEHAS
jgi:hypothetical protein